jgi:hypothetical protein
VRQLRGRAWRARSKGWYGVRMGLIEIVLTVCALSLPDQCEERHLQFAPGASMSLKQCAMNAQPYIAQWMHEHPKWNAVRWRCEYGGSEEKT